MLIMSICNSFMIQINDVTLITLIKKGGLVAAYFQPLLRWSLHQSSLEAFAVTGFFVQPLLPSPLHAGFFVTTGFFDGALVGFFLDVFVQPLLPSPLHAGFFVTTGVGAVVCTDIIFRARFTFFQSTWISGS